MKIITSRNQKDYYDFLTGIYGIDEKIVLDRRKLDKVELNHPTKITVHVCDIAYQGYYKDNKFYWGLDLFKLVDPEEFEKYQNSKEKDKFSVYIKTLYHSGIRLDYDKSTVYIHPYKTNVNTKAKCPIMCDTSNYSTPEYERYPVLKYLDFGKVLEPKEIYLMLCEWLAPKEDYKDTRTDKDKIVSAGFDLKSSFRNM